MAKAPIAFFRVIEAEPEAQPVLLHRLARNVESEQAGELTRCARADRFDPMNALDDHAQPSFGSQRDSRYGAETQLGRALGLTVVRGRETAAALDVARPRSLLPAQIDVGRHERAPELERAIPIQP